MNTVNSGHTTTEELIVSYLDGELVRKELETVLFERLATSEDARLLMREYLTVRGAIHASVADDRFQLTSAIDARTKGRIELMLKNVPALEKESVETVGFIADKPLVTTIATRRSLAVWTKRAVPTFALLLLAIGTTWYVTRTTVERHESAMNTTPATSTTPLSTSTSQEPKVSNQLQQNVAQVAPERIKIVKEYIPAPMPTEQTASNKDLAQNATVNPPATITPAAVETSDPKDVMISHRYRKLIQNTPAITVTQQDRL
jgi:hypothetical protein